MDFYAPKYFRHQIEQYYELSLKRNMLHITDSVGQRIVNYYLNRNKLSKLFNNSLKKKQYKLQPPKLITIRSNKQKRPVLDQNIADLIVISVVADFLEKILPSNTYIESLKNKIYCRNKLIQHIKQNSQQLPITYFHINLQHCIEDLPIYPASLLWQQHRQLLQKNGITTDDYIDKLITSALRPSYYNADNLLQENLYGTAKGTPVHNYFYYLLANNIKQQIELYHSDLLLICGKNILFCSYDAQIATINLDKIKQFLAKNNIPVLSNTIHLRQLSKKSTSDLPNVQEIKFINYRFRYNGSCNSQDKRAYIEKIESCINNTIKTRAKLSPSELCHQLGDNINKLYAAHDFYHNKALTDHDRIDIDEITTRYIKQKLLKIKGYSWRGRFNPDTVTIVHQNKQWHIYAEITPLENNQNG